MPQKEIPCEDCDKEKERIEDAGDQEVISCNPIPSKPGRCLIVWRRKSANPKKGSRAGKKPRGRTAIGRKPAKLR